MSNNPFIMEAEDLHQVLASPGAKTITVLDASWYLPNQNRDGHKEYLAGHIPGALYFDIDAHSDPSSPLPHTLLAPRAFAKAAGSLGIADDDTIIVYDGMGIFSAARVWWNLRLMGANNVRLLNGGLPAWKNAGFALESGDVTRQPAEFIARPQAGKVRNVDDVKEIIATGTAQMLDARAAPRFRGEVAEPRAGLRSGHMPGALNLPFDQLLEDGKLRPVAELREIITATGLNLEKPVVTTCGSGVTAAVLTLALLSIGHTDNALYDGSWSEWGGDAGGDVVKG